VGEEKRSRRVLVMVMVEVWRAAKLQMLTRLAR